MMIGQRKKKSERWYDWILLALFAPVACTILQALLYSCRIVAVKGKSKAQLAVDNANGSAIYATWHQRIAFQARLRLSRRPLVIMISASRDGVLAAKYARWLGVRVIHGSSSRKGAVALKEMIKMIRQGYSGGMVADGPLGPPRVVKSGTVALARASELPLIGVLWGADRCWVFNSWDRFILPKPFARVSVCYTDPIWVSGEAGSEEISDCQNRFEKDLNRCANWCDTHFGAERPWKRHMDKNAKREARD